MVSNDPQPNPSGPSNHVTVVRRRQDWLALALLAIVFAIGWVAVAAWRDVPVIDDYAYAWSVEHLLKTGQLAISERSSVYPVVQILWGALFSGIFGFSFGVLRVSTVILAVVGCWAIYLTLRELAFSWRVGLLVAMTVAVYPTYFALAFSFMTDVPLVSLSALALYFYVAGVRRDRPDLLWWGSAFAVGAFLVRQVAIVLPLAALAASDRRVASRASIRRFWIPVGAGIVTVCALWVALPVLLGPLPVIERRQLNLTWENLLAFDDYPEWNAELLWVVVWPFAPVLLCSLTRWRRVLVSAAIAVLLVATLRLTLGAVPTPMPNEQTWSLQDLALRTNLIGGAISPSDWTTRMAPTLGVLGAILVASFFAGIASVRSTDWRAGRVLVAAGLLHLIVINLLWTYYDRYYLVLVPTVAYLAAVSLVARRVRMWPAVIVLTLWATLAMTGTRAMLATTSVCAAMAQDLEAQGVPASQIDAGYALNGWHLYSHPENLPSPAHRDTSVPFITTDRQSPYRIVTKPEPGEEILRSEELPSAWWQVHGRLYLVHHRIDGDGG
jgi:4-amino-4-deoxy-L-arabinose transferase-like glycosyltransferase